MPLLSTRGAVAVRPFGFAAAKIPDVYYIGLVGNSSFSGEIVEALAVDTSKNLYLGGYDSTNSAALLKISSTGILSFQKNASGASNSINDVVTNGNDVYIASSYSGQALVYKTDGNASVAWARTIGGANTDYFFGVAVDPTNGDVYCTGRMPNPSADTMGLVKYNSSGTIQWQVSLSTTSEGRSVVVGQDGFIYVGAKGGTTSTSSFIAKYNSSGVLQAQYTMANPGTGNSTIFYKAVVDASSNMYVVGTEGARGLLCKLNSSGVVQWSRLLGSANITELRSVAVASNGNVYVTGYSGQPAAGARNTFIIAKYNSSGTLQWQRSLSSGVTSVGQTIRLDQDENVYVGGYNSPFADDMLFAKLPPDGSKTGTYSVGGTNVTYAETTMGEPTLTVSFTSGSGSSTTTTHSNSSAGVSFSNTSITNAITTIP